MSESERHKEAKVVQQENSLAKELTLLRYTIGKLVDTINILQVEIKRNKVIQVPYPVYPPLQHEKSNIPNPPYTYN